MKNEKGRKYLRILPRLVLASVSAILSVILFDRCMGLAGFPRDFVQIAHPPEYHRPIRNIDAEYEFRTNSQGLRNRETPLAKPGGFFRVFVSGDSFTEGELIADGNRWSDLLEARFERPGRRFEVVNGGIAGSGPMTYAGLFRQIGVRYEPDLWLIMIFPNDLQDTPLRIEKLSSGIYREARKGRVSRLASRFVPHVVAQIKAILHFRNRNEQANVSDLKAAMLRQVESGAVSRERYENWLKNVPPEIIEAADQGRFNAFTITQGLLQPELWVNSLDLEGDGARARWANMRLILTDELTAARAEGIATAVVYAPVRFQYDATSVTGKEIWSLAGAEILPDWLTGESNLQRELAKMAADLNVPFLDLTARFRALSPEEARATTFRYDFHWTERGHRLVAEWLGEWLESTRTIPGRSSEAPSEPAVRKE